MKIFETLTNYVFWPLFLVVGVFLLVSLNQQGFLNLRFLSKPSFGTIERTAILDLKGEEEIKYDLPEIPNDFPKRLPVYKVHERVMSFDQSQGIAYTLGFPETVKPEERLEKLIWQSDKKTLEAHILQGVVYYQSEEPVFGVKVVGSEATAATIARDLLLQNNLLFDLQADSTYPVTTRDGLFFEKSDSNVRGYAVVFARTIDKLRIVTAQGPLPSINGSAKIIVGLDGKIKQLLYKIPPENGFESSEYPILSGAKAASEFKLGKARLVSVVLDGIDYFESAHVLSKVSIETIDLVYIDQANNQIDKYLEPHYRFVGNAILTNGKTAKVTFLLNALSGKYLK